MLFGHNPSNPQLIVAAERNPSYLQLLAVADQTDPRNFTELDRGVEERHQLSLLLFWWLFRNRSGLGRFICFGISAIWMDSLASLMPTNAKKQ
jgi:hypothetical protein